MFGGFNGRDSQNGSPLLYSRKRSDERSLIEAFILYISRLAITKATAKRNRTSRVHNCTLRENYPKSKSLALYFEANHIAMKISTIGLFLPVALLGFATASCPPVDEPCMNDDNHATCLALHKDGCQNIRLLESCPLQFQCAD